MVENLNLGWRKLVFLWYIIWKGTNLLESILENVPGLDCSQHNSLSAKAFHCLCPWCISLVGYGVETTGQFFWPNLNACQMFWQLFHSSMKYETNLLKRPGDTGCLVVAACHLVKPIALNIDWPLF